MSDLTDRLRESVRWFDYKAHTDPCDENCRCVIREAADVLDAIDALHQSDPLLYGMCAECEHVHPCPTYRILHPEETE